MESEFDRGSEAQVAASLTLGTATVGKNIWRSARRFIFKRILHADDTPHRIALGVAISTFVGFSPIMGMQTVVSIALAALFRANKAVCLPFVWITNPVTFVPVYWSCWETRRGHIPQPFA